MAISMLKIRRPLGRLIFNMGIAIPGKTVFLFEKAPRFSFFLSAVQPQMEAHIWTDSGIAKSSLKIFFNQFHAETFSHFDDFMQE